MIAILTALELEYSAVRAHLTGLETHRHDAGTIFELGSVQGHPDRKVAIAAVGKGNGAAATITERAIQEFQPGGVVFVGIAGGLWGWLPIGDIVVATRVYAYQGGRVDPDGFQARPQAWDAPHHMEQIAKQLARSATWLERLASTESPPSVHFEPIAAGDVVLNATDSPLAHQLRGHYNDAAAIEMESAGVAHAGHLNDTPTMTVRAISDLADGDKTIADRAGSRLLAARNAAAFAVALIAELDEAAGDRPRGHEPRPEPTVNVVATGNARVGNQIGVVHRFGGTHIDRG